MIAEFIIFYHITNNLTNFITNNITNFIISSYSSILIVIFKFSGIVFCVYMLNNIANIIHKLLLKYYYKVYYIFNDKLEKECSICLENCIENYENPQSILFNCNHAFHKNCIKLMIKNTLGNELKCPMCRRHITDSLMEKNYKIF
jgi:hypothetical protein